MIAIAREDYLRPIAEAEAEGTEAVGERWVVLRKRDRRLKLTAQDPEIAERTIARHQLDRKNASAPAGELVREVTVVGE